MRRNKRRYCERKQSYLLLYWKRSNLIPATGLNAGAGMV